MMINSKQSILRIDALAIIAVFHVVSLALSYPQKHTPSSWQLLTSPVCLFRVMYMYM